MYFNQELFFLLNHENELTKNTRYFIYYKTMQNSVIPLANDPNQS